MPTFGSLFSGIGGLDLGLERAGWECKWQVEIDGWCRRILKQHWPSVPRFGDIRVAPFPSIAVDLICGGFPCQPVSQAGRRLGQDDPRWLWPEFVRIVRLLRPRYVLVENVPGLLSRGMGDVLGDLAALGFDAEWSVLSACAMGASHTRERVFIVAYPQGTRLLRTEQPKDHRGSEPRRGAVDPQPPRSIPPPGWWAVEPNVDRVAYGIPRRMDRARGLGNAVVPQVAEWIGRRLMESM